MWPVACEAICRLSTYDTKDCNLLYYKSPSVNYNDFNSELESLFDKFQFNCDFNMDLMKHNENRGTQKFIDIMFNVISVISKPTRITLSTNSLIDNIFTTCINDDIYSGLLINDLSDHLPIFIVNERNMNHNNSEYQPMYIRNINENTLQNLKMLLNAELE